MTTFTQAKRLPALLYYLDGLFQVPICIQIGKIFTLQSSGKSERMTIPDFHMALHQEPDLYNEWIAALRLPAGRDRVIEIVDLAGRLLDIGRAMLETDLPHDAC